MLKATLAEPQSDRDLVVTRPAGVLPTTLEPGSPEARGYPADPKPGPEESPGLPHDPSSEAEDLARTA